MKFSIFLFSNSKYSIQLHTEYGAIGHNVLNRTVPKTHPKKWAGMTRNRRAGLIRPEYVRRYNTKIIRENQSRKR